MAIALLQMPANHPAAVLGHHAGWTIPLDYEPVHVLFRELNLPPYQFPAKFTFWDAIKRYWYGSVLRLGRSAVFGGRDFPGRRG